MLRFDKATTYHLFSSFLRILFSEFINTVSIVVYNFIEFIILLYTFLVISVAQYKEYITCLIVFIKFSNVLPAFTCANIIGSLWSIYSGAFILGLSPWIMLFLASGGIEE